MENIMKFCGSKSNSQVLREPLGRARAALDL